MLISELEAQLKELREQYGDLPVALNADQGNPWKQLNGVMVFAWDNPDYPLTVNLS